MSRRAVVFAYHDVGDRCLRTLKAHGWDIPLVVTHAADPSEPAWFANVAETARQLEIPFLMPESPNQDGFVRALSQLKPDFLFSFYYRHLLGDPILAQARRAALNLHGSLLPRYRGRAPVNWAILNGEQETGATLHHMVTRADAGDIVDQQSVPILEDDDARAVMGKVTAAAEQVLARNLTALADGTAPRRPQNLLEGEYCGRRRPEDGRIDLRVSARRIHDLVRAVAPPYPGAFLRFREGTIWIHRTRRLGGAPPMDPHPRLCSQGSTCVLVCGDGQALEILSAANPEGPIDLAAFARELGNSPRSL